MIKNDMIDIEWLIKFNYHCLNMDLIREYFRVFNRENELDEIIKKVKNVK